MKTQPQDIIKSLEETNSKLEKEAILEAAVDEDLPKFFEGLRLALDPLHTFGVKKVPIKDGDGQGLPWEAFLDLQKKLLGRVLTGHAARDAIQLAMDVATEDQWNGWYRRILIKDLRCGMSEKTVNKVLKKKKKLEWMIPVFGCQLAHDSTKHEKKVTGTKLVEVKLDGVRVVAIVRTNGHVELFSRNGRLFTNFQHIEDQIGAVVKENPPPYDIVLDGEVMSDSFQDLMKQVHRKSNVAAKDATLFLFDFLPYSEWLKGEGTTTQLIRSQMTQAWVNTHKDAMPNVDCLAYESVDLDTDAGKKRYLEINRTALAGGYEGIMIKDPTAIYKCKRSDAWLKLKPFIEVSLEVINVEEGTGRNEGKLGALVCKGIDDGKEICVNVGSGFSDDERDAYWKDKEGLIEMIAEVRADAVTQNQDGTYSLRFPRFKGFRGFDPHEKI